MVFFFFIKKIEHNAEIIAKLRVNGGTYQILGTAVYCLTCKISGFEFLFHNAERLRGRERVSTALNEASVWLYSYLTAPHQSIDCLRVL